LLVPVRTQTFSSRSEHLRSSGCSGPLKGTSCFKTVGGEGIVSSQAYIPSQG
jgi:hypothetical protein